MGRGRSSLILVESFVYMADFPGACMGVGGDTFQASPLCKNNENARSVQLFAAVHFTENPKMIDRGRDNTERERGRQ